MSTRRLRRALLLVAVFVAAFLRFWQLDTMPPGLYHDEAYNGLDALSLTRGVIFPQFYEGWELYAQDAHAKRPPNKTRFPVFFEGNYGREPLHIYLMALSIGQFGATPFAVRAVPAAAGVVAVITTYVAASLLLGAEQADEAARNRNKSLHYSITPSLEQAYALAPGFAALALAILYPAVHFSRFGIRAMLFVPIETLTVAFFWMGINALQGVGFERDREREVRGRHSSDTANESPGHPITPSPPYSLTPSLHFILAGILLGLGIYTYAAARLFPLLFMLFIPLWLWHSKRWRSYWRYAALMAIASIGTALPLLLFFWRYPYFFVFRIAFVSNKGTGTVDGRPYLTWLFNIGRVLRGLVWRGETHLRHNLPGRPYLDPIQLGFFVTGSVAYFYRWNRMRPIFVGLWLGVMLLPSILSGDAPHFGRLTGAAPVVAILIGIGAAWLWQRISQELSGVRSERELGLGERGRYSSDSTSNSPHHPVTKHPLFASLPHSLTPSSLLITFIFILFTVSAILTFHDYFFRYANHPQVPTDFYLHDWALGQYAAAQPKDAALYLTPTQEEMATIYFALADPERMRSYAGGRGLVPLGNAEGGAVYFVRPIGDMRPLTELEAVLKRPLDLVELENAFVASGAFSPALFADFAPGGTRWGDKIELVRWRVEPADSEVTVRFLWRAVGKMERPYTAFVHLVDAQGNIVAQLDRPPAGYPTTDWQPGEFVYDPYSIVLPGDLPGGLYQIRVGFYDSLLQTPLGDPIILTEVSLD